MDSGPALVGASRNDDGDIWHALAISRRDSARVLQNSSPSPSRGRREHRMLAAPASLACKRNALLRTQETTGQPEQPAFPAQWFDGLYAFSPVSGLFSHRRLVFVTRGLIPASGDQDRAISPYARSCFASAAHASIASRRHVRDDRETPLRWSGTGRTIRLICVSGKANYFCKEGLTRFRKISPSGKSGRSNALVA